MSEEKWTLELGRKLGDASETLSVESLIIEDHCLLVGSQGAGKTWLGMILIDEIAELGAPVLAIDARGDLSEWIERVKNRPGSEDRFQFLDRIDARTLDMGVALSWIAKSPLAGDEVKDLTASLLALLGFRPRLMSPEFSLIEHILSAGRWDSLSDLVGLIEDPPFRAIGLFEIDRIISPARRRDLAQAVAGAFGMVDAVDEPWDFDDLLQNEHGGKVVVLSFEERMPRVRRFLLATALAKFKSWVEIRGRSQAGPNAMVYIDEGGEFLPDTGRSASAALLHEALESWDEHGVGLVLVAQEPSEVDEPAKDLIETWLVGKLPVPQSRQEAVTALDLVNPPVDEVWLDKTLASLEPGQFVLRSCRLDELQVFEAR